MRKLYRSRENRVFAGLCGGIGEMMGVDPTIIRLLLVFVSILTAVMPALLTYIVAWMIVPEAD
jgi:phage shock protein PspC (stress-responsive transcriptional regulator)